jgi:hypothetical protein
LKAGELLFREGDAPEGMFVVKKGKLVVYKAKGNSEIELATVGPGSMIGEMAFFDRKPRSASIRAHLDSEIIELPFKSLQAQYDTFPEWLKAIVKTINDHLREANKRIKNLEQAPDGSIRGLTPYQTAKLSAILMFVATKWGSPEPTGGIDVKPGLLRKFTIQVFQEPTNKMQMLMAILQGLGFLKQEDLGEGKVKITLLQAELLEAFVEWITEYNFKSDDKKVTVNEEDLPKLRALVHFGKKLTPDEKGEVKVSLVVIQNESMKELSYLVGINDFNKFISAGITSDKISEKDGTYVKFKLADLEKQYPFWQLYYACQKGA